MKRLPFTRALRLGVAFASLAIAAPCCARLAAELEPPASVLETESFPRHDDPDAVVFNDLPVRLYFHSQTPPAQTQIVKPVRVLFRTAAQGKTCREAGIAGLQKLQRVAMRNRVNAVVNIRSTWDGAQTGDTLHFGCRRASGELSLVWEGALANVPEEAEPPAPDPAGTQPAEDAGASDSASARIRELQSLYYQGLITREEFLERRQKILDGL